jgi:methionyl-tRNA formyltransferase
MGHCEWGSGNGRDHDADAIALGERLSHMGAELLVETLRRLERGTLQAERQDSTLATYAPILKKDDGRMDWTWPAERLHCLVRGMRPWPGAQTKWRGNLLHIWIARLVELARAGAPGELRFNRDGLFAAAGDGRWLKLIEVQMEGRKKMSAVDFARGQRVGEDERLG